jgi:CRP-like cAMP-binding protein
LYQIPKEDFAQLIFNNREVSAAFIRLVSGQVVDKEQKLLDLAYNTVRKRVADALYLLNEKYINEEYIPASRTDLASIVGTATESVIRNLSEFKESKIIEVKGNKIKILDKDKLASIQY